ncbi:hypothetical protein EW145_g613 [Phellinidium pouzarii]|uniref:60S ribosomal protein L36 n=1 Tax=Phellinidium pouzarii TaxID=167371 RepID=A0A4S4LHL8_9AGAM|nr:hypothetical protein EW145_g613 [Phellinidium pouzarii]
MVRNDFRRGLNMGHPTTAIPRSVKPSHKKGIQSTRTKFVRSIVREVAGFAPYERRVMELLRNSKDKRARKLTKKRLGTLLRSKRKLEELGAIIQESRRLQPLNPYHSSFPDPENTEERREIVVKLLSQDPGNYEDAPTEGIRRVLEIATGENIPRGRKLPTDKIDYIRLSTTVATNALLERKGHKHALCITKGFKDLLVIGNQSRPKIFDLNIRRPAPLYSEVLEIDERVTLVGYTSDPNASKHGVQFDEMGNLIRGYRGPGWDGQGDAEGPGEIVRGVSGEAVRILKRPDPEQIRYDLKKLHDAGYRSIAIVLVHSYTFPEHEQLVASLARELGFAHISVSSQLLSMIKMVPRGVSSTADAYLTPILYEYLDGFFNGFDEKLRKGKESDARVEFMGSDGGLLDLDNFSGLKSILSGPAGGVVGYALTSWDEDMKKPVIGHVFFTFETYFEKFI